MYILQVHEAICYRKVINNLKQVHKKACKAQIIRKLQ